MELPQFDSASGVHFALLPANSPRGYYRRLAVSFLPCTLYEVAFLQPLTTSGTNESSSVKLDGIQYGKALAEHHCDSWRGSLRVQTERRRQSHSNRDHRRDGYSDDSLGLCFH